MNALVISGGGSKGAFAGGVAEYLIREKKRDYDILIGTSTGSLLIPHLAIGKIDWIKNIYTNITNKDIYSISPFTIKKEKDGSLKAQINHFNIFKMILQGKKTFGEHKNLRKTIEKTLSKADFERIKKTNKKIIATVSNLHLNIVEYKYLGDCSYEDFCDWMWISTSFVPFMGLVEKNGYDYADGGFGNIIPIEEAINLGAKTIDVIVLHTRQISPRKTRPNNSFDVLMNSMHFMHTQLRRLDLLLGQFENLYNKDVNLNFFFTPSVLTENSFLFDPPKLKQWWDEGYLHAKRICAKPSFIY
jgi:predicted patatin/cPLA2 family phospholipase